MQLIFLKQIRSFQKILSLPPTAPLRSINDVQKCLDALKGNVDIVTTMTESHRNPWFNMVTYSEKNNDINLINKNDLIKEDKMLQNVLIFQQLLMFLILIL